jgi:hypothetical protein
MANKAWNDFLPSVLPSCKGVPISQARQEIRAAAIDFCEETLCWVEALDNVSVQASVIEYMLDPPSNDTTIAALTEVKRSEASTALTAGTHYAFDNVSATLTLLSTPGSAYTLEIKAALRPARTSAGIPAAIFEHFLDGIAARAKSRILGMVGHAWSDPQMAMLHEDTYLEKAAEAKRKRSKQYTAGNSRVAWRPFGL